MEINVRDKKWDEDFFLKERKEVLSIWPTGKEVDIDEAIEYQKGLSERRSFVKVVEELHREGRTVVFPRAGTPILEDQIELNRTLVEAGLCLIPVTPDSYCRGAQFERAQKGLEESIRLGRPMLNGYPTAIHGVKNTRKMTEANEAAYNQRWTNIGGVRLMAEIAFASGMTAALADPFLTLANYEKNATPEQCIRCYQYIHRLVGYYAERGVILTVDFDGPHPCGVFPFGVDLASIIVAALMAAEQGVKSLMPRSLLNGNMAQDIAWARVLRRLVREYLDKFGYKDVLTPGLFLDPFPLYPYPQDMGWAFGFTGYLAVVAALAEAEATAPRTIDEAAGIPTKEAHAITHRAAKWIFDIVRAQKIHYEDDEMKTEEKMTELEIRAIIDKLLELGDGDLAVGYVRGVEAGVIDTPFCPNVNVKDKALGVRDSKGALRYLNFGNIPVPEEVKEFHREKVAEREKAEGRKMDYKVAIEDLWSLSKGKLIGG